MKKALFFLSSLILTHLAISQTKNYDSLAILIVDRMSDVIGDLESCSYKLEIARDVDDAHAGLVKHFTDYRVYMSGPDKLLIHFSTEKGQRQLWYNGSQLAYYFKEEHNFGIIPAPATTMEMIDTISRAYDFDFPAADFFYPTFTDDLLLHSDELKLAGRVQVNGKECFHIVSSSKDLNIQLWITADEFNLPLRFVIINKTKTGSPQYQGNFSEWVVNPNLPSAMFDFEPPPGSSQLKIMPVSRR